MKDNFDFGDAHKMFQYAEYCDFLVLSLTTILGKYNYNLIRHLHFLGEQKKLSITILIEEQHKLSNQSEFQWKL